MNQIALRREFTNYSRKADAKIALLEDVIRRVHKGEDVDIEKALGTGDPEQEQEWKEGRCTSSLSLKAAMHYPRVLEVRHCEAQLLIVSYLVMQEIEQAETLGPKPRKGRGFYTALKKADQAAAAEKEQAEALEKGKSADEHIAVPESAATGTVQTTKKGLGRFY